MIIYRESWKPIGFQYTQLNPAKEMEQIGKLDPVYSSAKEKLATPVHQTKTSQSCWCFAIQLKLNSSTKVIDCENIQIT